MTERLHTSEHLCLAPLCRLSCSRCQQQVLLGGTGTGWMGEMNPLDVGLQPQGDGRTPGIPAGCSGGSACPHSSTETVMPQSCVCLRVPAAAEPPVLAGGRPGPGGKKLFWSVAHGPAPEGAVLGGGISLLERRGAQGSSRTSSLTSKDSVKHKRCLWHDSSLCPSATGAEPQCTSSTSSPPAARPSQLPRDS